MRVTMLTAVVLAVMLMALPMQTSADHTWGRDPDQLQTPTQTSPCDCEKVAPAGTASQQLPMGETEEINPAYSGPPVNGAWVSWLTYLMCYAVAWDESCPNGSHITIEF